MQGIADIPSLPAAVDRPTTGSSVADGTPVSAGPVALTVSPALQGLAGRYGEVSPEGRVILSTERYVAAAHRLAHDWSRWVPLAVTVDAALAAGTGLPPNLSREVVDALLVHDHECHAARDRVLAKALGRDAPARPDRALDAGLPGADPRDGSRSDRSPAR